MTADFAGKTALITGSGRGIGRAAVAVLEAGRVDILVNNAATVEPPGPTIAIPAGDLRRPGSAARIPGASELACTSGSTRTSPTAS